MIGGKRHAPPLPPWITLPGIAFQSVGVFLLPFFVGMVAALFFEISQVVETFPALMAFMTVILLPVSLAQVLGVLLKSRKEFRFWREHNALTIVRVLHVLYTHLRVVTTRGWMVLGTGLFFTLISLAVKWASLGVMAALSLFLFYTVVGWTVFLSTFLVHTFESGLGRAQSGIQRQVIPAVCVAGEPVEEVFSFRKVPVPWGYVMLVEEQLPYRLMTESRYSVGGLMKSGEIEVRGRLRATPRGQYFFGPARIWYQDILGITRVSVASVATAELEVLPRIRPVQIIDPPHSQAEAPDVITRPHRFATEDFFRFREYSSGDDTRRIHWRLSLRTGRLQVRRPETKEIQKQDILLVLDTFLPTGRLLDASMGADRILDGLVDAWLGIAKELVQAGDQVTLAAAVTGHVKDAIEIEKLACRRGQSPRWQDIGARASWQGKFDLPFLLNELGEGVKAVVVTARFTSAPQDAGGDSEVTWLFMDPIDALGEREPHWVAEMSGGASPMHILSWMARLPSAVGSEENSIPHRARETWRLYTMYNARQELRTRARRRAGQILDELKSRGDAVYRIEPHGHKIVLKGICGRRK